MSFLSESTLSTVSSLESFEDTDDTFSPSTTSTPKRVDEKPVDGNVADVKAVDGNPVDENIVSGTSSGGDSSMPHLPFDIADFHPATPKIPPNDNLAKAARITAQKKTIKGPLPPKTPSTEKKNIDPKSMAKAKKKTVATKKVENQIKKLKRIIERDGKRIKKNDQKLALLIKKLAAKH